MVGIANALPEMTAIGHTRLARAMATIAPVDDFAALFELIAKRDELLGLA